MGYSKVVYNGKELINLMGDDVKPQNLLKGIKAHDSNGDPITGSCDYDFNTSSDEIMNTAATAAEILSGKTAAVGGFKVTGTMKNNAAVTGKIATKDGEYTIPQGYHDGSGKVKIDETAIEQLKPENVREGRTILGVVGTMTGNEAEKPQPTKEVNAPLNEDLVVGPDDDYTCLTEVVVKKVPYEEIDNTAEGKGVTVIIG